MKRPWTTRERVMLKRLYADTPTNRIAKRLGRTLSATYQCARNMGLKKDAAFIAKQSGKVLRKAGEKHRFKAGHKTWNAGKKGWQAGGRAQETQFKKGSVPKNTYRPVGSERTNKEGEIEVKVSDPNVWKTRKQIVWEETNGPVPDGMVLRWINGKPELINRAENMKLNSVHRYPRDIKFAMRVTKRLTREIAKHEQD